MAIKEWVSKFATGLGLDDSASGGMQTLVNTADTTRVSQVHAVRDSIIALEKQVVGAPWFSWNEADLTQFDALVVGSAVNAQTVAVESFAGQNWIGMEVDGAADTPFNTAVFLPISTTPPDNYAIVADFLNVTAGGGLVGGGVFVRFDGVSSGYWGQMVAQGAGQQELAKISAGVKNGFGPVTSGIEIQTIYEGARALLAVRGTVAAEVLLEIDIGGRFLAADTGVGFTSGKAGIVTTTNGSSVIVKNLFRNIRCYNLVA